MTSDKDVEEGQRQDMEVMEEQIYNEGGTVLGVVDVLDRSTGLEDRQTTTPSVWEQAGLERNMTEV